MGSAWQRFLVAVVVLTTALGLAGAVLSADSAGASPSVAPAQATANAPGQPPVDPSPLVAIHTMAKDGNSYGVLLNTYGTIPVVGCPKQVLSGSDVECFYADPTPNSWAQIVVLNRSNLAFLANRVFQCPEASAYRQEAQFDAANAGGSRCTAQLSNYIGSLSPSDLVVAVNQPGASRLEPPVGLAATLGSVGSNRGIGADPVWFFSGDHGAHLPLALRGTFSAIGVPGWPAKQGISKSSAPDAAEGSGALNVDVALDNSARYSPINYTSVLSNVDNKVVPVAKVLYQAPTPWPEQGEKDKQLGAERAAAVSRLGMAVELGSDPRNQFYSKGLTYDWQGKIDEIRKARFGALNPPANGFDAQQFAWAKSELINEISDVKVVTSYVRDLSAPYAKAQARLWSTFSDAVNTVTLTVNDAPGTTVYGGVAAVTAAIASLAALLPITAVALPATIVSGVYTVATHMASYFDAIAYSPFKSRASGYGVELADRLNQAQDEIEVRWRNIIVADYGKLTTVALCSESASACTDNAEGWAFTINSTTHLKAVLELALQRDMYEALVPARYHLAINIYVPKRQACTSPVRGVTCVPGKLPSYEQVAKNPSYFDCVFAPIPFPVGAGTYILDERGIEDKDKGVYVLTNEPDSINVPFQSASGALFSRMFDRLDDSGNFQKGGLGINETQFFRTNYFDANRYENRYGTFGAEFPNRALFLGCGIRY